MRHLLRRAAFLASWFWLILAALGSIGTYRNQGLWAVVSGLAALVLVWPLLFIAASAITLFIGWRHLLTDVSKQVVTNPKADAGKAIAAATRRAFGGPEAESDGDPRK
jgi:hypothetical protein